MKGSTNAMRGSADVVQSTSAIKILDATLQNSTDSQPGLMSAADHQQMTTDHATLSTTVSRVSTCESNIAGKHDLLTFDSTPTEGSNNPITSGGVYSAINNNGGIVVMESDAYVKEISFTNQPTLNITEFRETGHGNLNGDLIKSASVGIPMQLAFDYTKSNIIHIKGAQLSYYSTLDSATSGYFFYPDGNSSIKGIANVKTAVDSMIDALVGKQLFKPSDDIVSNSITAGTYKLNMYYRIPLRRRINTSNSTYYNTDAYFLYRNSVQYDSDDLAYASVMEYGPTVTVDEEGYITSVTNPKSSYTLDLALPKWSNEYISLLNTDPITVTFRIKLTSAPKLSLNNCKQIITL